MNDLVPYFGAIINFIALYFVYKQVRNSSKMIKSQISTNLIYNLYSNSSIQALLYQIYSNNLIFNEDLNSDSYQDILIISDNKIITSEIDMLLNQFQTIGLLYYLTTISKKDLAGLEFEIISIGRNVSIKKYLNFLNSNYQEESKIIHDHFRYFKSLYLDFEYDVNLINDFKKFDIKITQARHRLSICPK